MSTETKSLTTNGKQEFANSLRALANKIEGLPDGIDVRIEFRAYRVSSLEDLRAMAALTPDVKKNSVNSTHWLYGTFADGIEVTTFYEAGLLGTRKKKRVRVVETEETDLSLLAMPANAS